MTYTSDQRERARERAHRVLKMLTPDDAIDIKEHLIAETEAAHENGKVASALWALAWPISVTLAFLGYLIWVIWATNMDGVRSEAVAPVQAELTVCETRLSAVTFACTQACGMVEK